MSTNASDAKLQEIRVDLIDPNKENPRIHFRQKEMDELMESMAIHGIQVPVSVFRDGARFTLIDGERRWRSALKLNLKTIPALVQEKPDRLTNLLLMFNIHALREQWDLLTIATKLATIIELLERQKKGRPTEIDIARQTGLSRGVIRRCRYLLELPVEFRAELEAELKKPKRLQKLTEDLFIEMERALTTVQRAMPEVLVDKTKVRHVLLDKFKSGVIDNRTHFRQVAKIARAARVEASVPAARKALTRLFQPNQYSIKQAYENTVAVAYSDKDIAVRLDGLLDRLRELRPENVDAELRKRLKALIDVAQSLLGSGK